MLAAYLSAPALLLAPRAPALGSSRRAEVRLSVTADFFEQAGWATLEKELSEIPVFAVGDGRGRPLQSEFQGQPKAIFFMDVDEAQAQLDSVRGAYPGQELNIAPIGLDKAWKAQAKGDALLVPSKRDLKDAGMEVPADGPVISNMGCPMYACMDLEGNRLDGTPCVPLYVSRADAESAVKEVMATFLMQKNGKEVPQMDISTISLDAVIQGMVTQGNTDFRFMPSTAALHAIQKTEKAKVEAKYPNMAALAKDGVEESK